MKKCLLQRDKGTKRARGSKGRFSFGPFGPFGSSEKAFTLIELLVVVAIIGVLSALLLSNFIGVRQRARDAQRKSDLRQIQSALELYRADQGAYPSLNGANVNLGTNCGASYSLKDPAGSTTYMQAIPCDPSTGKSYTYNTNGTTYTLVTCLENGNDSQKDSPNNSSYCDGTTTFSYTVANP